MGPGRQEHRQRRSPFAKIQKGQALMTSPRTILSATVMLFATAYPVAASPYTFTTVADNSGRFRSWGMLGFGHVAGPSINSAGTVAFFAFLDAGGSGIFTGDDPLTDTVIRTGDALFGSTVTDLSFFRGLNDNGDITFRYHLADGRTGVAVAVVPEPASWALSGLGGLGILVRRRRR
jgi:PEP-CTERM motif